MLIRYLNIADFNLNGLCHFLAGVVLATLAYFANVKGAIHVMWACFVIDFIIGFLTARKIRRDRFDMSKAFIMLKRMMVATSVILLLFATDKETGQNFVKLYNIMAWIVSGMLCWSILENGDKWTNGKFFLPIRKLLLAKMREEAPVSDLKVIHKKN